MAEINEIDDPSKNPKNKANSNDPGWEYGFWPDRSNKDVIQCILCDRPISGGIKRFKQHLAGGYGDVVICQKTTTSIRRKMEAYLNSNKRNKTIVLDNEGEDESNENDEVPTSGSTFIETAPKPSSGTAAKRKRTMMDFAKPTPKANKSIASIIRKSPEEVVAERHSKGPTQQTLEEVTRTQEEKDRVYMHIANFFYECGIPFNVANARAYEIMIESIGQYGPGLKPPSYHELRVPLLKRAKEETDKLREKHEIAWKEYGCTLMSDGWMDKRGRHLINFLVNSPEGTFFLGSVDASSESHDATLLTNLLDKQIEEIGRDKVVQVVTDNGSNYKAAGKQLMEITPTLFWTPCAAHCIDLMMEDICGLKELKGTIISAKRVTRFIYRHGRLLDAMREKTGGWDLVRPAVTRFATAFLTLQSMYRYKDPLRTLFVCDDWNRCKLAKTEGGKNVQDIILSTTFWNGVEDCLRASQPLLVVLRIVDGDERPAITEVSAAMDVAKDKLRDVFKNKQTLLKKVLDIVISRWEGQMGQKLYGAALYLSPDKFFDIKIKDPDYAGDLRSMFNDVLEKMVVDEAIQEKISNQADDYSSMRGTFGKSLTIKQQKTKTPLDWWAAFGNDARDLQKFAKRIIGLCCSSSGCERNWSTFEFIHTKKRNRLEHQRLNDLVYIQYNRRIAARFQKLREEREKSSNYNPLCLDDFQWENEWVDSNADVVHPGGDLSWAHVDEAIGASTNLLGRNLPRTAANRSNNLSSQNDLITFSRRRTSTASTTVPLTDEGLQNEEIEVEVFPNDDEEVDDDYGIRCTMSNHEATNTNHEMVTDELLFMDDY